MRVSLFLFYLFAAIGPALGQKTWSASNGIIKFVSAKNSDVAAANNQVSMTVNEQGEISFNLLVREFKFEMSEMEEHFNRNYMETEKYPEASFRGRIFDFKKINLTKAGLYKVKAEGLMTIHNVAKKIVVSGTLQILDGGAIVLKSKFPIDIDDYKVDTGLGGMIIGSTMNVEVEGRCESF
jgi:polyisoprenoid-binding protein YceI